MQERSPSTPRHDDFYSRVFALLTTLILGYLLYNILQPFFGPIAWAIFLAFLLHPLHRRLVPRFKGRRSLSAMLLTLLTLILLVGPLTGVGAAFLSQVGVLVNAGQDALAQRGGADSLHLDQIPGVGPALLWLDRQFGVSAQQVQAWTVEAARSFLQVLASLGGKFFIGALGGAVGFTLTMFLLYFFIRDGQRMFESVQALIPLSGPRKQRLLDHLGDVTRAVVFGTGMTALLQGVLVGIAFLIVQLPSPVVFGALAALLALLPIGGTGLVWGPAAIVLAIQGRWIAAAFMLIWGVLLVGTIDNLLRPILVSGRASVSTLTVFIGVLGGVAAFGTIGLFLGPVVLALVIALLRFIIEVRQEVVVP